MLMKKCVFVLFLCIVNVVGWAQDSVEPIPLKSMFWGTRLVDAHTTNLLNKRAFSFEILHRFQTVASGMSTMFGVYGSSNIAMGVNYGLLNKFQIGFLSEKMSKTQEFSCKYSLLQQNIDNSIPVSIAYNGMLSIDGRAREKFGKHYRFTNRLFYTHQLIVSKQIAYKFNLATWLSIVHFNKVSPLFQADKFELAMAVGYRFHRGKSFFIRYMHPWDMHLFEAKKKGVIKPKPGLSIGIETGTSSHKFQVFFSTRKQLGLAKDLLKSSNSIAFKNLSLGFNMKIDIWKHHK